MAPHATSAELRPLPFGASVGTRCIGQDTPTTPGKPQNPSNRCPLTLTGEIDLANAQDYLALAQALIAECQTEACFPIDLSGVTFMDSTGLVMLVGIRKAATDARMELRLEGTPTRVSRLVEITAVARALWRFRGRSWTEVLLMTPPRVTSGRC